MRPAGLGLMLVLASGCGRFGFGTGEDAGGAADAAGGDAAGDANTADCWASWQTGAPALSEPILVSGVNTAQVESNPSLSTDGLTLYFDRGEAFSRDLFAATRSDPGSPTFAAIHGLEALNTTEDETRVSVSADGLIAIFASVRETPSFDLYEARRETTEAGFGAPTDSRLAVVNSELNDVDPELSGDGLRLYLAPEVGPAEQRIMIATRTATDDPFPAPQLVEGLGNFPTVFDPTLSPDERVLVFSVLDTSIDLYVAVRPSTASGFSGATKLAISTAASDSDPELSSDGCELFFASDRDGNRNLWVATIDP